MAQLALFSPAPPDEIPTTDIDGRLKDITNQTSQRIRHDTEDANRVLSRFRASCVSLLHLDRPASEEGALSDSLSKLSHVAKEAGQEGEIASALWRRLAGDRMEDMVTGKPQKQSATVQKARSAVRMLAKSCWGLCILELYAIFGDVYMKYRFLEALRSLAMVQTDFTRALDAMLAQRTRRCSPVIQGASAVLEWQVVDVTRAMTAILPGAYVSRAERAARKRGQTQETANGATDVDEDAALPSNNEEQQNAMPSGTKDVGEDATLLLVDEEQQTAMAQPQGTVITTAAAPQSAAAVGSASSNNNNQREPTVEDGNPADLHEPDDGTAPVDMKEGGDSGTPDPEDPDEDAASDPRDTDGGSQMPRSNYSDGTDASCGSIRDGETDMSVEVGRGDAGWYLHDNGEDGDIFNGGDAASPFQGSALTTIDNISPSVLGEVDQSLLQDSATSFFFRRRKPARPRGRDATMRAAPLTHPPVEPSFQLDTVGTSPINNTTATSTTSTPTPRPRLCLREKPLVNMATPPAKRPRHSSNDTYPDDASEYDSLRLPTLDHFAVGEDDGVAMLRQFFSLFTNQLTNKPPMLLLGDAASYESCIAFVFDPAAASQATAPCQREWALAVTDSSGECTCVFSRASIRNISSKLEQLGLETGEVEPALESLPNKISTTVDISNTLGTLLGVAALGTHLVSDSQQQEPLLTINPLVWLHVMDYVACVATPLGAPLCSRPGQSRSPDTKYISPRLIARSCCVAPPSRASLRCDLDPQKSLEDDLVVLQRQVEHHLSEVKSTVACRDESEWIRRLVSLKLKSSTSAVRTAEISSDEDLATQLAEAECYHGSLANGALKEHMKKHMQDIKAAIAKEEVARSTLRDVKVHLDATKTQYDDHADHVMQRAKALAKDVRRKLLGGLEALEALVPSE
ncbi:hypothetical protein CLAFUW4_14842 [Fulvia fulva]|nr:hypothetical protein CLAFUR0_14835 [Fulvia fulva]WPV23005.1 hypothetical protein CLAFUW4_14842 [Fulvia fulva]WPV37942.1 hypothetical protein CLAFUW7_14843 [Fulvia fulva]